MEERGFDTTLTAGAAFELLRDATELVPGVSELVLDELGAGLRPATPDNSPVIGAGDPPGLYWATGHHRNGILLAPVTAGLLADALVGEGASELAIAFAPGRFDTGQFASAHFPGDPGREAARGSQPLRGAGAGAAAGSPA